MCCKNVFRADNDEILVLVSAFAWDTEVTILHLELTVDGKIAIGNDFKKYNGVKNTAEAIYPWKKNVPRIYECH